LLARSAPQALKSKLSVIQFVYYQFTATIMEITSITIVYADGSIVTTSGPFAPITAPALPSPEDVEIDVVLSDRSTKKFVPAA
jgi:hypothetical protein